MRPPDQIALPLDWPQGSDDSRFIIGAPNRAAVEHLSRHATWPVRVTFMTIRGTTLCQEYDLFRLAPLLSRAPAIMSILIEITRVLAIGPPGTALHLGQSTVLLACYLLWGRADLLLLRR